MPIGPLFAEPFVEEACRSTGLSDFGGGDWRQAFEVLLRAVNEEARLSQVGLEMFHGWVLRRLTNRLKVVDWARRHSEVRDERVEKPIFVCGMPRTGTTILHNLLSQDPRNRPLMKWESMDCVPPPEAAHLHDDPRIERARQEVEEVFARAPEMKAVHFEPPDGPTECVELLTQHFMGHDWSFWVVPSYFDWFDRCDTRDALRYHKLCLQLLQSRAPGRWILKATSHTLYLDALFEIYPDARVIIPHRDPAQSVPSMAGLSCSCKPELLSEGYDAAACMAFYGPFWMKEYRRMVDRMMAFRDVRPDANVYDLRYVDFIRDPIGSVREIYAHFGDELCPDAIERMERYLGTHPKGRFGSHHYSVEQFGLSEPQLADCFAHYNARYGLDREAG